MVRVKVGEMLLCSDLRRFLGEGRSRDAFPTTTELRAQQRKHQAAKENSGKS